MNRFEQDIEFDENFQPVIGKEAEILGRVLPYMAALSIYLFFLDLSFLLANFLIRSPIVIILSALLGFIVVIAGWFLSFLLFGLFGGNFGFAKSVFFLFNDVYFRVSIIAIFMSVFLAKAFAGVLARTNIPYSARIKLFWALLASLWIEFSLFCAFVNKITDNPGRHYFMYVLLGIVYLCIIGYESQEKPKSKLEFPNDYGQKRQENYSWQDLRDVFQDL